jgi:N-acetylmuramoyl-L-alanine amidase
MIGSRSNADMTFGLYQRTFIFLLILCWFAATSLAAAERDTDDASVTKRYDEAKFYYTQLQNNDTLGGSRDNWLKGTRNFRRIYLSNPKSDLAPACLFMLGRIYSDMYDRFNLGIDLDESISYYKDLTRLYSSHRLADDAYLALGQLFLNKKNNPQQAADFLTEIVLNYPNGDMHPTAEDMLKDLSLDHNIPLPKVMVSSSRDNKLSYVLPVKYWSSDSYTRVVIMASGPINYKEVLLEETKNTPRRLYIDFQKSYIEPQYRAPVPIEDGLLRQIRTGQFSSDTVRVVLDIESIDSYKIFSLPDPFRVVIDVRGHKQEEGDATPIVADKRKVPKIAKKQQKVIVKRVPETENGEKEIVVLRDNKKIVFGAAAREAESLPATQPLSLAQQLGLGVRRIIIDPGHGGKDPGAMAFGLKEKDIVLSVAKKLQPKLAEEIGCEVILTRNDDSFVSLEERTAIANTKNADLFVSLHINAHPSNKVRGLETYYLNLTTNAEAMRVAARENATSTHQMSDLQDILSDIMKNSKINESSRLAQQVHNAILTSSIDKGHDNIKNLGVKQAPFYVLIGAQMPAILIEIAFISNESDVKNLTTPVFIDRLTKDIADGIRAYISDTSAQLQ